MLEVLITPLIGAFYLYAVIGLLFGILFVIAGAPQFDSQVRGSSFAFRLIILPASAALWPLLLYRWATLKSSPVQERNPHR